MQRQEYDMVALVTELSELYQSDLVLFDETARRLIAQMIGRCTTRKRQTLWEVQSRIDREMALRGLTVMDELRRRFPDPDEFARESRRFIDRFMSTAPQHHKRKL